MKKNNIILVLLLIFSIQAIYSQSHIVTGEVRDMEKEAMSKISVSNMRTGEMVYTDADGKYSIEAQMGDTLLFFENYSPTQQIIVDGTVCNVCSMVKEVALDEIKVIGYIFKFPKEHRPERRSNDDDLLLVSKAFDNLLQSDKNLRSNPKLKYIVNGKQEHDVRYIDPRTVESISIQKNAAGVVVTLTVNNSEYEVTVLEEGYDTFLKQQQPKEFFTEQELKSKNIPLVNEWNMRCNNPSQYDPAIYEAAIDYSPATDYGLDVEYNYYPLNEIYKKATCDI
jgi:hypothetical protein